MLLISSSAAHTMQGDEEMRGHFWVHSTDCHHQISIQVYGNELNSLSAITSNQCYFEISSNVTLVGLLECEWLKGEIGYCSQLTKVTITYSSYVCSLLTSK